MIRLLVVRHAETTWNRAGRIQGHTDVRLSAHGRRSLRGRSIPAAYRDFRWTASPLRRAMETAALLGGLDVRPEPRLMEMSWGGWEGSTRRELVDRLGAELPAVAGRGLDFQPPAGESPRLVIERLASWLADVAAAGEPLVAVTHKGVIGAMLAMATGWDMTVKPPHRLDWARGHLFSLDPPAGLRLDRPNVELESGGR